MFCFYSQEALSAKERPQYQNSSPTQAPSSNLNGDSSPHITKQSSTTPSFDSQKNVINTDIHPTSSENQRNSTKSNEEILSKDYFKPIRLSPSSNPSDANDEMDENVDEEQHKEVGRSVNTPILCADILCDGLDGIPAQSQEMIFI